MQYTPNIKVQIPKYIFVFVNNLFEIEKKLALTGDAGNFSRNVVKMREALEENGVTYENPEGQPFNETRADLEASISGAGTENLFVVEVIKLNRYRFGVIIVHLIKHCIWIWNKLQLSCIRIKNMKPSLIFKVSPSHFVRVTKVVNITFT